MKKLSLGLFFMGALLISAFDASAQLPKGLKTPKVKAPTTKSVTESAGECVKYTNKLKEIEAKILKSVEDGKSSHVSSGISEFKRTIKLYKGDNCPNVKKYEDKIPGFYEGLDEAKITEKCNESRETMKIKDAKCKTALEEENINSLSSHLTTYRTESKYYKKTNCGNDASKYEESVKLFEEELARLRHEKKCREAKEPLDLHGSYAQAALEKDDFNRLSHHRGQFNNALANYKNLNCLEDYSEYDAKIDEWGAAIRVYDIKKDPLAFYTKSYNKKDKEGMEDAFKYGLDIKTSTKPLQLAIESGDEETIDYLLKKGANINLKDEDEKVPLDYKINYDVTKEDIDMFKYLISKGADLKLADGRVIASRAIDARDFDFYKKVEAVNSFSTDNYRSFYWEAPDGSEMDKYFAEKIKNGNVGKSWADVIEKLKTPSLKSEMLAMVKQTIVDEKMDIKITKIKITSTDWGIYRNSLTGIITHKGISTEAYGTDRNGVCFYKHIEFQKQYDGSKYGKTYISFWHSGINIIDCD